jgi:acyl-CoA thioesterase-1
MTGAPDRFFIRRSLLAGMLAGAAGRALAARAKRAPVVTILGDSITAGLGLPQAQALPAQLQAALAKLGAPAVVRGAGVSGDTSAAGLARLDFSVQPDTELCVVALGGNDLLQGLDPKTTHANLDAIVRRLQARKVKVVLAGVRVPPVVGANYAREFDAIFPNLAKARHVALYPDLFAGISPTLVQPDGIHPNAAGARIIAAGLAPVVAKALRSR